MEVCFETEYVKLQQFLKLANVVSQGSDAKILILQGGIKVNGESENRRGRKIYDGYTVEVDGKVYNAVRNGNQS